MKEVNKALKKIYKLLQKSPSVLQKGNKFGKLILHKDVEKLLDYLEDVEDYAKAYSGYYSPEDLSIHESSGNNS